MNAFLGNSLEQILPFEISSPARIRKFLNHNLLIFVWIKKSLIESPIPVLTSFRMIQMFGGKSNQWIIVEMHKWLTSLGLSGGNMN